MKWMNPKVATLFGVPLHIHLTTPLFMLATAWVYTSGWQMLSFLVTLLVIYASVIAHEYGHVLAGRYCGVGCRGVTLTPLGGVALLERVPASADVELIVTAAGPVVSLILAIWATALAVITFKVTGVFVAAAVANYVMFVFNLLPVFPMDGGRILRALLHYWLPLERSTWIAGRVGQGMACLVGFLGLVSGSWLLPVMMLLIGCWCEAEIRSTRRV